MRYVQNVDKALQSAQGDVEKALGRTLAAVASAPAANESLADIAAQWSAVSRAMPQVIADLHAAQMREVHARVLQVDGRLAASARADIQHQLRRLVEQWRHRLELLRRMHGDSKRQVAKLEGDRAATAHRLHTECASGTVDVVYARASDHLRKLRSRQLLEQSAASEEEHRARVGRLSGVVAACSEFSRAHLDDLRNTQGAFEEVLLAASKTDTRPDRAAVVARLVKRFHSEVFEPALRLLERSGVAPEELSTVVRVYGGGGDTLDPFCVRRCVAAEQVLRRLLSSAPDARRQAPLQQSALAEALDKADRLRADLEAMRTEACDALAQSNAAAGLRAIQHREKGTRADLAAAEEEVARLAQMLCDRGAAVAANGDKKEAKKLLDVVTEVRAACAQVHDAAVAADRVDDLMRQTARDQFREAAWSLLKAGERAVGRAVEAAADEAAQLAKRAADRQKRVKAFGEDIAVLETACAAQKQPGNFTTDVMRQCALREQLARAAADLHAVQQRRLNLASLERAAEWIVREAFRLSTRPAEIEKQSS